MSNYVNAEWVQLFIKSPSDADYNITDTLSYLVEVKFQGDEKSGGNKTVVQG